MNANDVLEVFAYLCSLKETANKSEKLSEDIKEYAHIVEAQNDTIAELKHIISELRAENDELKFQINELNIIKIPAPVPDDARNELPFGRLLADFRKAYGLSQDDIGSFFGVSRQAVGDWENGRRNISKERMDQFLEDFHLTADLKPKAKGRGMTREKAERRTLDKINKRKKGRQHVN